MNIEIISSVDINGRALANFVYEITDIPLNIWITKNNRRINAKSILGLLSIGISKGDSIIVTVTNGNSSVCEYIKSKFE